MCVINGPIIEAFGNPGVGKSHVVDHLVHHVAGHGGRVQRELYSLEPRKRVSRVLRKVWLMCLQMPSLLPHLSAATQLMRQSGWSSRSGAFSALFNWVMMMACQRHLLQIEGPVILGQGAFQAVWSLAYRARPDTPFPLQGWVDLTLSVLKDRAFVVLLVRAKAQTVAQRLDARTEGQSVLDQHRDDDALARSQRIVSELTALIEAQVAKGRLRLVVHDNNEDGISDRVAAELAHDVGLLTAAPVHND